MSELTVEQVLELVPQKAPFRFLDEIISIGDEGIRSSYRFKEAETFYPGHFPGNPLTPGVILLEAMAQTGVVAYGIWLAAKELDLTLDEIGKILTVFTDAEVEFLGMVRPGQKILIEAKKQYFRRMKLKVSAEAKLETGEVVSRAQIAGMGVRNES